MAQTALERLAGLLGAEASGERFSAQTSAPAEGLRVEVAGVGPVAFPIRAPMAERLIAVARPAMFGQGTRTLRDREVRDTWELSPDQFALAGPDWPGVLDRALEKFRDDLALPAHARLRAQPHALLVYGKGQFFLPHRDSEKDDSMVGTVVVSLPSVHTGGDLVVEHAGRREVYRGSRDRLGIVAFYADCRHEVTRVGSGHRVALTFNLLVESEPTPDLAPDAAVAACLTEHFAFPGVSRYGHRATDLPNRLVFLLDHSYSQRALAWSRLKGEDAERAAVLRAAAVLGGCEAVLALAEVKETWDALPAEQADWDDGYWDYEDEEGRDGGYDDGDYRLTALVDDEIALGWWTRPDGRGGEEISLPVAHHEVCTATPSAQLAPYRSEYEGYMGNYGNTLDRWYRRAAVVVWPRERAFAARAEAGSRWALEELLAQIDAGDVAGARAGAASLAPFWGTTGGRAELLGPALAVATGLADPQTAAMLVGPYRVELLSAEHAGGLAAAARRYGRDWVAAVVAGWFGERRHYGTGRLGWVQEHLPHVCAGLARAGEPAVCGQLTAGVWRWLDSEIDSRLHQEQRAKREQGLKSLSAALVQLLDTAEDPLRGQIAATLRPRPDAVLELLVPALRLAGQRRDAGLAVIAADCTTRLEAILARPARAEEDWSIAWSGCGCDLCAKLGEFLAAPTERVLQWPLKADGRGHVHGRIDAADLPVRHVTRRQGRPFTLVLTKTDALFARAAADRDRAAADLAWLRARGESGARVGVRRRPIPGRVP